jgi:hypothetical protein
MDCDNTLWIDAVGVYTNIAENFNIEQTGQRGSKLHMAAPGKGTERVVATLSGDLNSSARGGLDLMRR